MRTKLRSKISLLFVACALLLAVPAVALAAELFTAEVDGTVNEVTVEQGKTANFNIKLSASGSISKDITSANASTAKVEKSYSLAANGTLLKGVLDANNNRVSNFSDAYKFYSSGQDCGGQNCDVTWDNAASGPYSQAATISADANTPTGNYTIALSPQAGTTQISNPNVSGGKLDDNTATNITVKVVAPAVVAPTNQAPSTPGTISSDESVNKDGTFTLSWGTSTDPDGDSVTYTLEQKDNDDGTTWSPVASGLTSASYTFGANNPEPEGTWDFRVKAVDSKGASSGFSTALDLVNVDQTNPNAPTLSFDTSASQSLKATVNSVDWYKDSALINVTDNGDPNNASDSSTGSGVDANSFPASFSVSQNGTSTASKTVKDKATNESSAGILQVNVDAANPTLGACPSGGPFILNSGSQLVGPIGASDSESGVDNAASTLSGSVDASSIGIKQVTFTAVDNVGHQTQKICSYSVIYKFDGFRQPVDNNGVFNVAKAGSAIPMKFSLFGNQGLNILNPNPPKVTQVVCPSSAPLDTIEETVAASNSGLTYDASIDQYNYVWKTQSTFSTKCYKIDIKLDDGTSHEAYFKFTK